MSGEKVRAPEYRIPLTCPACGQVLDHVTNGRPTLNRAAAICRCAPCRRSYRLEVHLIDLITETQTFTQRRQVAS